MTQRMRRQQAFRSPAQYKAARRQRGAAILAFMLILVTFSAYFLIKGLSTAQVNNARDARTVETLAEAKQALIDYAVTFYDRDPANLGRFGVLPCPDIDETGVTTEGSQHGNCALTHVTTLGRLPWKSLGIEPSRDGFGECLWYVVTGSYKENPPGLMLNEDSNGVLEIYSSDGTFLPDPNTPPPVLPSRRAVAAVFAPGGVLNAQNRFQVGLPPAAPSPGDPIICGGNFNPAAYLDPEDPINPPGAIENYVVTAGADDVQTFVHADNRSTLFNDRIVYVTREEVFAAIRDRASFSQRLYDAGGSLTEAVAFCLQEYATDLAGNGRLPWAAPADLGGGAGVDYRVDAQYSDANGILAGRFPNVINNSDALNGVGWASVLAGCSIGANPELATLYRNWKDHLFYAVAQPFQPGLGPPGACGVDCLTVNAGPTLYAAVVIFSRERFGAQSRDEPPGSTDRENVGNYLEGANAPGIARGAASTPLDYDSLTENPGIYNDVTYCVGLPPAYAVSQCCLDAPC